VARTAVVLFNLGGPDRPEAVKPFLINLFSDPAILRVPAPLRVVLARLIAGRRVKVARGMYDRIGGGSPILKETEAQARALNKILGDGHRVFIAMRYWHPLTEAAAREVKAYAPERIVLLPLYPQFSTSTTASSLAAWRAAAPRAGLDMPTTAVESYPTEPGLVRALTRIAGEAYERAGGKPRVLFSAHGLPKKFVDTGDPYATQVERTVTAVVAAMAIPDLDYRVCYQSRIGPLEWLKPYTIDEVREAARARRAIVVVPVAFVSEHSETLVELDMDYRELAEREGASAYLRAPTVSTDPAFIEGLARLVREAAS
jgi:ferrochelatase